jgi:hypothetical protein
MLCADNKRAAYAEKRNTAAARKQRRVRQEIKEKDIDEEDEVKKA